MLLTADAVCPQCGENTPTLHEGYCERCRDENQAELDQHNAGYNQWQQMTDSERERRIRDAAKG